MVKFIDPSIYRKRELSKKNLFFFENSSIPMPSEIEISESGTCNRKCSFCPRSAPDFKDEKKFIKPKLHSKLCNELKKYKYKGVIRYSGFVEPLLDKNIYSLIKESKEISEDCRVELVTNGDVLNKSRLKNLFLSGLSTILISVYDTEEDALRFEKMCRDLNLKEGENFIVRRRFLSEKESFGITMSNRAGMLENAIYKVPALTSPMKSKCTYPSYTFFMDYNGDVLMCAHDWGKKRILGNLTNDTFYNIWINQISMNSRKMLNSANRNFAPCNVCDVQGSLIGQEHQKAWDKYFQNFK